jgi:heme/copper-type cytochrome/quinol oxidase subunit 2
MKSSSDLSIGDFRIIDVDSNCVVPFFTPLQILVTSADVIHSFALPNLAIKIDCNPGYLSSIYFQFETPGIFYGLCRELCGVGHSAMRICIERTSPALFKV